MNILITGSSRGIGFGLVTEALGAGHKVFAVARNTTSLKELKTDFPDRLLPIELDISQPGGIETLASEIAKHGSLDILVNNAGIAGVNKPTHEITSEEWDATIAVNLKGVFLCTKHVLPTLVLPIMMTV